MWKHKETLVGQVIDYHMVKLLALDYSMPSLGQITVGGDMD